MNQVKLRVIAEQRKLDKKIAKLHAFMSGFGSGKYKTLSALDQELLSHQLDVMREYSKILGLRITNFEPTSTGATP